MTDSARWVWLNGALVKREDAVVSIEDRGFRFGDGVFETIRVTHHVPIYLPYHLERLNTGLTSLYMPMDTGFIPEACANLIRHNDWQEGLLRISISRGSGSRGYLPLPDIKPTVVMECIPLPVPKTEPFRMMVSSYQKPGPAAYPTHAKTAQGLNSTLARLEAQQRGFDEALLLDHQGHISEASAANIFFLQDGTLKTPAPSTGCLLGITRRILLEYLDVEEGCYTLDTLKEAEALALTNTSIGAVAVASLSPVHDGFKSISLAGRLQGVLADSRRKYMELHLSDSSLA